MIYNVKVNDKDYKLELIEGPKNFEVKLNGRVFKLSQHRISGSRLTTMLTDNRPFELELVKDDDAYDCWLDSQVARCEVIDEKTARYARLTGNSVAAKKQLVLKAPMPGLVVRVEVEVGQKVNKGDGLVIVEAMKMENELKALHAGVVKEIKIQEKAPVEKNQVLIVFE